MKYTGVIFDFNGTLFFDAKYHELAWNQLISTPRSQPLSNQEMKEKIHGATNTGALEVLFPGKFSEEEKEKLSLKKEAIYRKICTEVEPLKLVNGAEKFFDLLIKNEVNMTIASASIIENINFFIERFKLHQWFDTTKIIYDDGSYENKVKMFEDAGKQLGINKDNCLIFEDSKSGIEAAIKAGFTSIIGLYDKEDPSYFRGHKEIIYYSNNYEEIIEFLEFKKED